MFLVKDPGQVKATTLKVGGPCFLSLILQAIHLILYEWTDIIATRTLGIDNNAEDRYNCS